MVSVPNLVNKLRDPKVFLCRMFHVYVLVLFLFAVLDRASPRTLAIGGKNCDRSPNQPTNQRVGQFVVHDLFERFLEKTGEASLWWTRDRA